MLTKGKEKTSEVQSSATNTSMMKPAFPVVGSKVDMNEVQSPDTNASKGEPAISDVRPTNTGPKLPKNNKNGLSNQNYIQVNLRRVKRASDVLSR